MSAAERMGALFGWCLPTEARECQNHAACRRSFTDQGGKLITCACPRHESVDTGNDAP